MLIPSIRLTHGRGPYSRVQVRNGVSGPFIVYSNTKSLSLLQCNGMSYCSIPAAKIPMKKQIPPKIAAAFLTDQPAGYWTFRPLHFVEFCIKHVVENDAATVEPYGRNAK
jgi:hypothetical protein